MKILNGLLGICALLLFYLALQPQPAKPQQPEQLIQTQQSIIIINKCAQTNLSPNLKQVIDQLYPL